MLSAAIILCLSGVCLAAQPGTTLPKICGRSQAQHNSSLFIIGGTDALVGEFPWQALLTPAVPNENWADFCGAAIINEKWVVTAAHCFILENITTHIKVRLGVHNESIHDKTGLVSEVEKVIRHENFTFNYQDNNVSEIYNDIALIKLKDTLDFSGKHKHLSPICLATSDTKLTKNCVLSGFGSVVPGKLIHPLNGILKKVDLPLLNPDVCRNASAAAQPGMRIPFHESMHLCAGGVKGKSACMMDSGSPFECQGKDDLWYQMGITSFLYSDINGCGRENNPVVFTKVSHYVDWIEKIITNN